MKLLIIEDDYETVDFISLSLNMGNTGFTLISADRGKDGVAMAESESPDLTIIDLGLPDINGFEVIKNIRLFSAVPILVLTARHEEPYVIKALEYGADDYVTKPFRQLELLARIKAISRRYAAKEQGIDIFKFKGWIINCNDRLIHKDNTFIKLTFNEGAILTSLLNSCGRVVTYYSLAEEIWGTDYPGSKDAIKVHINRLRQKLESAPELTGIIYNKPGTGYYINF
jgi:DNA-binding response OmpR family regulator